MACEGERWLELSPDRVLWRDLVALLNSPGSAVSELVVISYCVPWNGCWEIVPQAKLTGTWSLNTRSHLVQRMNILSLRNRPWRGVLSLQLLWLLDCVIFVNGVWIIINWPWIVLKVSGESLVNYEGSVFCGKVKLSLCLTKHHAMRTYWGVEV
jgi:hypothetical protein